jgi:hypothetical protein
MKRLGITLVTLTTIAVGGCADFFGQTATLNKTAVGAQLASGVAFNGAAVLVDTCVLDKVKHPEADAAAQGLANTMDALNADIQAGDTVGANAAIVTGKTILTQLQNILAGLTPTPPQALAMRAAVPKALGPKAANFTDVVAIINQFLPIILAGGTEIANLIKGFIDNVNAPAADATPAAVAQANAQMHAGLANWNKAACTTP